MDFLDIATAQIMLISGMMLGPIAVLFVLFPFNPLHASQAELQKKNMYVVATGDIFG